MIELLGIPLGTLAQLGTFGVVLVALIGAYVKLRDRGLTHAEVVCGQLTKQLSDYKDQADATEKNLRNLLKECEEECRRDIKKLHEEIFGMRKNNIAEQIAFINIILDTTDNPSLRTLRATLESISTKLETDRRLTAALAIQEPSDGE